MANQSNELQFDEYLQKAEVKNIIFHTVNHIFL